LSIEPLKLVAGAATRERWGRWPVAS